MIKAIYESGHSQTVYDLFIVFSFAGVFIINYWYSSKYNISKKQSLVASLLILVSTFAWIYILTWAETGFKVFGGKNLARGFIYIPLFAYPIARLLKIDWIRMCDFFAPCPVVAQAISKIGCIFAGCCRGYSCDFGIYNPITGQKTFPCQPFESIAYFAIAGLIIYYSKRKQYKPNGLSFPLMLMMFGTSRFLFEFARNNRKILLGCSPLSLHALFMAIVGCIAFVYIGKRNHSSSKSHL